MKKPKTKTSGKRKSLDDMGTVLIDKAFRRGVEAAAGVIEMFNGTTTHAYRLDDVVLCKLNVIGRAKPRLNKKKIADPKEAGDRSWIQGFVMALAEMHRHGAGSSAVVEVARDAGMNISEAKREGCDPYDWRQLKKAGVR